MVVVVEVVVAGGSKQLGEHNHRQRNAHIDTDPLNNHRGLVAPGQLAPQDPSTRVAAYRAFLPSEALAVPEWVEHPAHTRADPAPAAVAVAALAVVAFRPFTIRLPPLNVGDPSTNNKRLLHHLEVQAVQIEEMREGCLNSAGNIRRQ